MDMKKFVFEGVPEAENSTTPSPIEGAEVPPPTVETKVTPPPTIAPLLPSSSSQSPLITTPTKPITTEEAEEDE